MRTTILGYVVLIAVALGTSLAGSKIGNSIKSVATENKKLKAENNRLTFRLQTITQVIYSETNPCVLCHIPFLED